MLLRVSSLRSPPSLLAQGVNHEATPGEGSDLRRVWAKSSPCARVESLIWCLPPTLPGRAWLRRPAVRRAAGAPVQALPRSEQRSRLDCCSADRSPDRQGREDGREAGRRLRVGWLAGRLVQACPALSPRGALPLAPAGTAGRLGRVGRLGCLPSARYPGNQPRDFDGAVAC